MPQTLPATNGPGPGSARSVSLKSMPDSIPGNALPSAPSLGSLGSLAAKPKPGSLIPTQDILECPENMGLGDCLLRRLDAGMPYSFAGEGVVVSLAEDRASGNHDRSHAEKFMGTSSGDIKTQEPHVFQVADSALSRLHETKKDVVICPYGFPGRSLFIERSLRFLMRQSTPAPLAGLTLQGFRLLQRFLRRGDGVSVGTVFCELGYDLAMGGKKGVTNGTNGVVANGDANGETTNGEAKANGVDDHADAHPDSSTTNYLAQSQFLIPYFANLGETLFDTNQLHPDPLDESSNHNKLAKYGKKQHFAPESRPPSFSIFYEYLTWLESNEGRFVDREHCFFPIVLGDAVANARRDEEGCAELIELFDLFDIDYQDVVFRRLDMILWLSGLAEQLCSSQGYGAGQTGEMSKEDQNFAFDSLLECFGKKYSGVSLKDENKTRKFREVLEGGCRKGSVVQEQLGMLEKKQGSGAVKGSSGGAKYGVEWRRKVQQLCEDIYSDIVEDILEAVNEVLAERSGDVELIFINSSPSNVFYLSPQDDEQDEHHDNLAVLTVADLGLADTLFDKAGTFKSKGPNPKPSFPELLQQTTAQVFVGHPSTGTVNTSSGEMSKSDLSVWKKSQHKSRQAASAVAGWIEKIRETCSESYENALAASIEGGDSEGAFGELFDKVGEIDVGKLELKIGGKMVVQPPGVKEIDVNAELAELEKETKEGETPKETPVDDGETPNDDAKDGAKNDEYSTSAKQKGLGSSSDSYLIYDKEKRVLKVKTFGGFVDGGGSGGAGGSGDVVSMGIVSPSSWVEYDVDMEFLGGVFRAKRHPALKPREEEHEEGDENEHPDHPAHVGVDSYMKFVDSLEELLSASGSGGGGEGGEANGKVATNGTNGHASTSTNINTTIFCLPASAKEIYSSIALYVLNASHGGAIGRKKEHDRKLHQHGSSLWSQVKSARGALLRVGRAEGMGKLNIPKRERSPRGMRKDIAGGLSKELVEMGKGKFDAGSETNRSVLTTPGGPVSPRGHKDLSKQVSKEVVEFNEEKQGMLSETDGYSNTVLSARTPLEDGITPRPLKYSRGDWEDGITPRPLKYSRRTLVWQMEEHELLTKNDPDRAAIAICSFMRCVIPIVEKRDLAHLKETLLDAAQKQV